MLQGLINKAKAWRMKRNTVMIVADIKSGKMMVSYKGNTAVGGFTDNTLKNMVRRVRFEKSLESFLIAQGQLIQQVCQEKNQK